MRVIKKIRVYFVIILIVIAAYFGLVALLARGASCLNATGQCDKNTQRWSWYYAGISVSATGAAIYNIKKYKKGE